MLRAFENQLWSCQYECIEMFDKNLKRIKVLSNKEWGYVYDVAMMPNVGVVIACTGGLLPIDDDGNTTMEIDSNSFISVDTYNDTLYAFCWGDCMVRTYIYGDTWIPRKNINCSRFSSVSSIRVMNDKIVVYDGEGRRVDVLSLKGEMLNSYDLYPPNKDYDSRYHRLCQVDIDGALLIAEEDSKQLLLLDKNKHWSVVQIDPEVQELSCALYVGDILYVQGKVGSEYKLCKYIPT